MSTSRESASEYVMPEPDEEFHVETSTDKNDTSDEEDFELTDTEAALILLKHHTYIPHC